MNILSVEINNILSIENATLDFSDSGLVLVEGWNHDASRANGAGKTAIFNAITFALYDKLPRKVTASEILRRGAKTGSVRVRVRTGINETISITRKRPKGLEIEKDGVKQEWTQKELEFHLKLSYEQFLLSMYAPQGAVRFLSVNDSDKKNFLVGLLNLDEFKECKKFADIVIKEIESSLEKDRLQLTSLQSKIDAYSESLVDEQECKQQIDMLNTDIKSLNKDIVSLQNVEKPDLSKYFKLEDDIAQKQKELTSARTKRSVLHDQYRKLSSKIKPFSGSETCAMCGSHVDTADAKKMHEEEMNGLSAELAHIKIDIDACDAVLFKENSVSEIAKKLRDKKSSELSDYQAASERVLELQALIKTKTNSVQNLVLKLENNARLSSKIDLLLTDLNSINDKITENQRNVEIYKTISALYSSTGAQAYILDSVVESFNTSVRDYVDLVWPNVSYQLNSYKENSSGEVIAKFSETLTMDGKEVSIGSLSGGEQKALSLCIDFAMLDTLGKYFGMSLNPIILDEPFDGLDSVGREIVIDLLSKLSLNKQILVVDHASEAKAMFSQVISVEKKAGISTVGVEV